MGVTSRIKVTRMPTDWNARSADSRPAPGPLTKIATVFMPWSAALRAASSAAICAANGVLLREPLKPRVPALDHATTLPAMSVMVTIVLLNVDWTCTMPVAMFLLTFFLPPLPLGAEEGFCDSLAMGSLYRRGSYFLRDNTPLRGPLRVRALVCVR